MNRRQLLLALASASGCVASGAIRGLPQGSLAAGDTLLAFAETLIGGDALSGAAREALLEDLHLHTKADTEVIAQYGACARLLDQLAGVPFATLPLKMRQALVMHHRLVPGAPAEAAGDETARDIRLQIAPHLIAAYYRSPEGWATVGYAAAFPGRCAGLEEYTRVPR